LIEAEIRKTELYGIRSATDAIGKALSVAIHREMNNKKDQWEEEAKDHFIAELKAQGRGDWIVSDSDVVVDKETNRNFDYQLQSGNEFIALEIFRLVETRDEIIRSKSWSAIANSIAAELRSRGIKGYTIHTPDAFDVPRLKIPGFVSKTADRLEDALKQNPQIDPITVDGFEIKRIDDFPDVSLFATGPGGAVNPTGIAHDFIARKLPTKNKQLDITNHERIVLIVNWAMLVDHSNMIEACSLIDFSQFENIDKVYFEVPQNGRVHVVYDREIYAAFRPDAEPPKRIEPLFISWLANHLDRKEIQAFRLVGKITEQRRSLLWLPPFSREQLISFGGDFLKNGESKQLHWIIENLKDDPDPSIENAPDDPEGKFNDHLRTKQGESNRIIHSVRGRLCWLLMQIVTHPRIEDYDRIFEIVETFATGKNLYVRLYATVPLIELARRRFAKIDANTRFMSDRLGERIKTLALRMIDQNIEYPAVLEWVAQVIVFIQDVNHDIALRIVNQLFTIDQSEAASDISWIMIYFAFYRENKFEHLDPFKSDDMRSLLEDKLANGSERFRATAANHFKTILDRNEVGFDTLVPYFEALVNGQSDRVVNHHFYEIAAKQAAAHPDIVGRLIERAVVGELKSLDLGGREVWHSKSFSEAVHAVEHAGPECKERVTRIRKSLEPYKDRGRIYDVYDF
jgi:hypothetical protein